MSEISVQHGATSGTFNVYRLPGGRAITLTVTQAVDLVAELADRLGEWDEVHGHVVVDSPRLLTMTPESITAMFRRARSRRSVGDFKPEVRP